MEGGYVSIRNAPVYNPVPLTHWAEEYCMICNKHLKHQYFIGYVLQHAHRPNSIVRMMGAGFFCKSCEVHSRAIQQTLCDWEVIVSNKAQWEDAVARPGPVRANQVHVCARFKDGYGANPPFIQAVFDRVDHIKFVERNYNNQSSEEATQVVTPVCTPSSNV